MDAVSGMISFVFYIFIPFLLILRALYVLLKLRSRRLEQEQAKKTSARTTYIQVKNKSLSSRIKKDPSQI
ncbi:hypothetical protein SAMN05444392_1072 [Seinonella peptonophila]|uniref:Uncharacterized protein n=1 Tax=Seinonella peptonophila TaxID=112248 RepID=A0A1M4YKY6_9BACL|nr:hypothetical protein [Seinonella peptonophila]SHF06182.1 hypothetical protein SAMN05444392_1072 [Seinonella peptonophila]